MDTYYASGNLREKSHFYLNVNFEVLNGCKFKCQGCHVEKNAQKPIQDTELSNLRTLLTSFKNSNYVPWIAFMGPTDVLSAENATSVLKTPEFIELLHLFKRISFQTTYLDVRKAEECANVLKDHYSDMELEIDIVIDAAKILDLRYLETVERNKNKFLSLIGRSDVKTFAIMNVYDYDQTKIPETLKNYNTIHTKVAHLFETTIDYNFSFMRSKDIVREEFIQLSSRVKNLYNTSLASEEKETSLKYAFGKLTDTLLEKHLNFRNGKLYYSPLLYERFVTFHEQFEVPFKTFAASEYERFEFEAQLKQYKHAPDKDECENCPLLASCVERGVLYLLDHFESKKCPVAKEAFLQIRPKALEA